MRRAILIVFFYFFLVLSGFGSSFSLKDKTLLRTAKILRSPIEYRTPFTMDVFDFRLGFLTLMSPVTLVLDSTETTFNTYSNPVYRTFLSVDVDLIKYNFLLYIFPQNFIDFQTGIDMGLGFVPLSGSLPGNWIHKNPKTGYEFRYRPEIYYFGIKQNAVYQINEYNYFYFGASYSKARFYLYRDIEGNRYLTQKGGLFSLSFGFKSISRYVYESGFRNAVGVEVRFNFDRMSDASDPENVSPIKKIRFNSVGFYLTLNFIKGGHATVGDEANRLYRQGDYISAFGKFQHFLKLYPRHPRRRVAELMMKRCHQMIPFQEKKIVVKHLESRNYLSAVKHLRRAYSTEDPILKGELDSISILTFESIFSILDSLFEHNRYDDVGRLLDTLETVDYFDISEPVRKYRGLFFLHRGIAFAKYRFWEKAVEYFDKALAYNSDLKPFVDVWIKKVAEGYLEDVNEFIDQENIEAAIEYLRKAASLQPDAKPQIDELILSLEEKVEKQKTSSKFARDWVNEIPVRKFKTLHISPGMSEVDVERLFGKPALESVLQDSSMNVFKLWIYKTSSGGEIHLYFRNGKLFRIERF